MTNIELGALAYRAGFGDKTENSIRIEEFAKLKKFAKLVAAKEREAIAQLFEDAPALVPFAQNDQGGCLMCGFTPKMAVAAIRARGEA